MTDSEAMETTRQGWDFVLHQGAMLAMMPIEDWLEAFSRAETLGPLVDPTLYREYLYSGKGEIIKDVLGAALVFKRAIVKAQANIQPAAISPDSVRSDVEPPDVT